MYRGLQQSASCRAEFLASYQLIIKEEDGQWLSELAGSGTICEGDHALDDDTCFSHHEVDDASEVPAAPSAKPVPAPELPSLEMLALEKLPYRERLLLYYAYAKSFENPEEEDFARRILDNIFRYVLSRHQKLLFHAKRSTSNNVWDFISDQDALHETQLRQLWEGMKMRGWLGIGKEGKITTEVIMYATQDAEYPDAARDGPFIEFLGGKVWLKPLRDDISQRGWAHFYQFVACADCATAHAQTFASYQRMKRLAKPGYVFEGWAGRTPSLFERAVQDRGGIVHYASVSKGVTLETVRPSRKGIKCVFIERESRNWVFMRFPVDDPNIQRLTDTDRSDLLVYSRHGKAATVETNRPVDKNFWLKRVRSGNSTVQRKAARWTIDDDHCEPQCWFNDINKGECPCPRHGRGKKFAKQSIDVMVFDLAEKQSFPTLIEKICEILGGDEAIYDDTAFTVQKNKAYFSGIGRRFFHEVGLGL